MKKNKNTTDEVQEIHVEPKLHYCVFWINDSETTRSLNYKEMYAYLLERVPKNCIPKIYEFLWDYHENFVVDIVNQEVRKVKFDFDAAREEYKKKKRTEEFSDVLSGKENPNQKKKFTRRKREQNFYKKLSKLDIDF